MGLGRSRIRATPISLREIVAAGEGSSPEDAEALLRYIVDQRVRAGEMFAYGYWLLRLEAVAGTLELWELAPDGAAWVRGAATGMR